MTPKDHLLALTRRHHGLWREVDAIRDRMAGTWPTWCYLPLPGWAVAVGGGRAAPITDAAATLEGAVAGALGAWRMTQGIYRFDPDLYTALIDTPLAGDIPVEVLYRMPEWCVYIETPGLTYAGEGAPLPVAGAWMHLDWGHRTGQTKLRVVLDAGDLIPIGAPLTGTLSASLDAALAVSALHLGQHGTPVPGLHEGARHLRAVLSPLLSLLLYLCADDAEIGDGTRRPGNPAPRHTRRGDRLFQADAPTMWDVGLRMGAALRQARDAALPGSPQGERNRPRAHVRRAHWHTFTAGPGRAERRLKWLPPLLVNASDADALPATVRPTT